ncbi:MAG: hypothetical protein AB1645_09805 [Bacillota bacterium]
MMRFGMEDGRPTIFTEIRNRYAVYLDNDSLIELAKGDSQRKERFVSAIRRGGALLFSLANALEIGGPRGASAASVDSFLDALGPHWAPLELNPWAVVKREEAGLRERAPISEEFARAYFRQRAYELSPNGERLLDLSENFFRLSAVAEWSRRDRCRIMQGVDSLYKEFDLELRKARAEYERNPALQPLKPLPFDENHPAKFATVNLLRLLVAEWKAYQFTRNDVMDFCHAVVGTSAATLATLDRHWKRRVESLPTPNKLAKVFYRAEIDSLVQVLEELVDKLN